MRKRWPAGSPWLFPGIAGNDDGSKPYSHSAFSQQLAAGSASSACATRPAQPVPVTGHQFRHTLGTRLKLGTVASGASFDVVEYRVGIRDKGFGTATCG